MIKLMDKENIYTWMVLNILANGLTISNMDMVLNNGLTELDMKVNIIMERSIIKETLIGLMVHIMRGNSTITI